MNLFLSCHCQLMQLMCETMEEIHERDKRANKSMIEHSFKFFRYNERNFF